jgi:hypothetical protein
MITSVRISMAWLLGLPRTAECVVKGIIHRPAIEIGLQSPTENRSRARPEGDIVKSGSLQQDRDFPQLTFHMPGFSRAWHFRYVAVHKHLGPTAVLRRCAACARDTTRVSESTDGGKTWETDWIMDLKRVP